MRWQELAKKWDWGSCGAGFLKFGSAGIVDPEASSNLQKRHIKFEAIFSQHRSARPEVRVVEVGSIEMLTRGIP